MNTSHQEATTLVNEGAQYHLEGDLMAAQQKYKAAIAVDAANATAYNNLGFVLSQQQDYAQALPNLQTAVELNPESVSAHINIGNVYLATQEHDKAADHYSTALQLNPKHALAWESYARFFVAQGQAEEAAKAWHQALQLKPAHLPYKTELAIALAALQRYGPAIQLLNQVVQHSTRDARAWKQLGILYFMRKDYGLAEGCLLNAQSIRPKDTSVLYHLALVKLSTNDAQKALAYFREALLHQPSAIEVRVDLAVVLLSQAKPSEAEAELGIALGQDATHPKARYYAAVVAHQLGKLEVAETLLSALSEEHGAFAAKASEYLNLYIHQK